MIVYRIGKPQYSNDLSGQGAKLYGGRWNMVGTACVYTAQSRALALLEYLANVDSDLIPPKLCFTAIELSDELITDISIDNLPKNWKSIPTRSESKLFGSSKFKENLPAIKVPSVIIQDEFNIVLNANFAHQFKIIGVEDFQFDTRLK